MSISVEMDSEDFFMVYRDCICVRDFSDDAVHEIITYIGDYQEKKNTSRTLDWTQFFNNSVELSNHDYMAKNGDESCADMKQLDNGNWLSLGETKDIWQ